jgi:hypothetical protein
LTPRVFLVSYNLATSRSTVGADWARTKPLTHLHRLNYRSTRTGEKGRMELGAEFDIDEVLLPTDWAVSSVLSAH